MSAELHAVESNVVEVERLRTDAVIAADLRAEIAPILDRLCGIIARARSEGLVLTFNIGQDQFGRTRVAELNIVKPL